MDKESLAFGVLLAIVAQSLYDMVFYGISGQTLLEHASLYAFATSVLFFIVMFHYLGWFKQERSLRR